MRFKLFNHEVEIEDINYEESLISPHTGKELEKIYFALVIEGKSMNDAVQNEISNAKNGGIFSLNEKEDNAKEYRLIKSPYSYRGNSNDESTMYSYTLYLEEIERLNIESLIIDDLEVFPYEYEERYDKDKDAIIIDAKVKLTKDESDKLENLDDFANEDKYFKVVRNGISENELCMRFGKVIWSEDGEFIKRDMTIVEKIYDESEEPIANFFQPEMGNMKNMIAYNYNLNNEILEMLISKGIVTMDEIEMIKEKSKKDISKTDNKFYKVKDIDKFN